MPVAAGGNSLRILEPIKVSATDLASSKLGFEAAERAGGQISKNNTHSGDEDRRDTGAQRKLLGLAPKSYKWRPQLVLYPSRSIDHWLLDLGTFIAVKVYQARRISQQLALAEAQAGNINLHRVPPAPPTTTTSKRGMTRQELDQHCPVVKYRGHDRPGSPVESAVLVKSYTPKIASVVGDISIPAQYNAGGLNGSPDVTSRVQVADEPQQKTQPQDLPLETISHDLGDLSAKTTLAPTVNNDHCAVCLSIVEEDNLIRQLVCRHIFHASCIDRWLTTYSACCPVCKTDLLLGSSNDHHPNG
ncbi:hypothetical protein AJ80_02963 [Polytolypa hystricis UAMH7299]|uniref:RING-type E3 ubiquitin transferase n=1 Tax=Polytolypa hystricis (strain UAMH7299) TaxID=1447883 RepID=A0A2B7YFR3_POLH7|nr:hypothetical protein AJ80_02963 [Polytolypa hystricis UAMH7299]